MNVGPFTDDAVGVDDALIEWGQPGHYVYVNGAWEAPAEHVYVNGAWETPSRKVLVTGAWQ